MEQRRLFIEDVENETASITELCQLYGISRKTGYKWIDRYRRFGLAGLQERSKRPRSNPRRPTG